MATTDIHVRVDSGVKSESEKILKEIGITISDLVNMTLRKTVRERGIPFEAKLSEMPQNMRVETKDDIIRLIDEGIEQDRGIRYSLEEVREHIAKREKEIIDSRETVDQGALVAA